MEIEILKAAMAAIGSTFGKEAAELSIDKIKDWFSKAATSVDVSSKVNTNEIEKMAQDVLKTETPVLDAEVTRRNLARWFEVPQEEFATTPIAQLEPEVLIRHLFLEDMFKKWLHGWGYKVSVGEDFEGLESIDFTPDVYGKLDTLHGKYEIFVNLVCDYPPSQYRVRALLEILEAYATELSEFKSGDIYILATPFQFGRGTAASIRLQSTQEDYIVVKLEGDDIGRLQRANDDDRFAQLMEHVEKANVEKQERLK